ncbi:MAG: hypothetical protein V1871_02680 [Planctomycetota bacterium]
MTSPSKLKRPKWSLKTHFWAAILITAVASVCILLISKKNIWIELEMIVGVLSLVSLAYFIFLFYHGIRFEKNETFSITWKPFSFDVAWSDAFGGNTGGLFTLLGAEAGALGCMAGLLLDLIVSLFLVAIVVFILWLGLNIVTAGILILVLPLYFLFRRSLRVAVVRGKACHGNLGRSLKLAVITTIANMSWLYLVIFTGYYISRWLR